MTKVLESSISEVVVSKRLVDAPAMIVNRRWLYDLVDGAGACRQSQGARPSRLGGIQERRWKSTLTMV
jgi:hypothetical protein